MYNDLQILTNTTPDELRIFYNASYHTDRDGDVRKTVNKSEILLIAHIHCGMSKEQMSKIFGHKIKRLSTLINYAQNESKKRHDRYKTVKNLINFLNKK